MHLEGRENARIDPGQAAPGNIDIRQPAGQAARKAGNSALYHLPASYFLDDELPEFPFEEDDGGVDGLGAAVPLGMGTLTENVGNMLLSPHGVGPGVGRGGGGGLLRLVI